MGHSLTTGLIPGRCLYSCTHVKVSNFITYSKAQKQIKWGLLNVHCRKSPSHVPISMFDCLQISFLFDLLSNSLYFLYRISIAQENYWFLSVYFFVWHVKQWWDTKAGECVLNGVNSTFVLFTFSQRFETLMQTVLETFWQTYIGDTCW